MEPIGNIFYSTVDWFKATEEYSIFLSYMLLHFWHEDKIRVPIRGKYNLIGIWIIEIDWHESKAEFIETNVTNFEYKYLKFDLFIFIMPRIEYVNHNFGNDVSDDECDCIVGTYGYPCLRKRQTVWACGMQFNEWIFAEVPETINF